MPPGMETFEAQARTLNVTGTAQIKTGIGKIARVICVVSAALNITVYDDVAATAGKEIFKKALAAGDIFSIQCPVLTGIRVVFDSGTGQITVTWS